MGSATKGLCSILEKFRPFCKRQQHSENLECGSFENKDRESDMQHILSCVMIGVGFLRVQHQDLPISSGKHLMKHGTILKKST